MPVSMHAMARVGLGCLFPLLGQGLSLSLNELLLEHFWPGGLMGKLSGPTWLYPPILGF